MSRHHFYQGSKPRKLDLTASNQSKIFQRLVGPLQPIVIDQVRITPFSLGEIK